MEKEKIKKRVKSFSLQNDLKSRESKNGIFLYKKAKYKPTDFQSYVSFQEKTNDLEDIFQGIKDELNYFIHLDENYEKDEEETFMKNIKELKKTKIADDGKQLRATIPKKFVDEHKVTNKDSIEWKSQKGKLKGELVKDDTN